jgi:hypothetical protein
MLEVTEEFTIFFDLDNLTSISMEALTTSICASAVLVVFLDSETHLSTWCVSELQTAYRFKIPIITVIDASLYVQRKLIDQYIGLGFGYIFSAQVVEVSRTVYPHILSCLTVYFTVYPKLQKSEHGEAGCRYQTVYCLCRWE